MSGERRRTHGPRTTRAEERRRADETGRAITDPATGYDRWAATYDDADPSTRLDEPLVRALVGDTAGRLVLDLGCGTGRYTRIFAARGARVVGVDLSRGMLARAARSAYLARGRCHWVRGNAVALPFRGRAFDRVVSGLLIDHLPVLDRFFREIARVLRPGGVAVVTAVHPEMQRLTGPAVRFHAGGRRWRMPGYVHSPTEVIRATRRAELEVTVEHALRIDDRIAAQRPDWRDRVGRAALLVVAARKP